MRRFLVAAVLYGAAAIGAGFHAPIYEDHPAWNCRTMGNRICGPAFTSPPRQSPDLLTDIQMQRSAEQKYRQQSLEYVQEH